MKATMKPEFKIGQKVTFKPYDTEYKAIVREITVGHWHGKHLDGTRDDRVFYRLAGDCITTTTGNSIVESKLFKALPQ